MKKRTVRIRKKVYKTKITYDMARILLDHGLASRTKTKTFNVRTYLASKKDEIWVPQIDPNGHFELGQRYEMFRNYRQNSGYWLNRFLSQDPSAMAPKDRKIFIQKRDRYVRIAGPKLKRLEERFVEMFKLARQAYVEKDPILVAQLEAMKNVGIVLTRQGVRIDPRTHKRKKHVPLRLRHLRLRNLKS